MTYIEKMLKELGKAETQAEKDFIIYQIEVEKMNK